MSGANRVDWAAQCRDGAAGGTPTTIRHEAGLRSIVGLECAGGRCGSDRLRDGVGGCGHWDLMGAVGGDVCVPCAAGRERGGGSGDDRDHHAPAAAAVASTATTLHGDCRRRAAF